MVPADARERSRGSDLGFPEDEDIDVSVWCMCDQEPSGLQTVACPVCDCFTMEALRYNNRQLRFINRPEGPRCLAYWLSRAPRLVTLCLAGNDLRGAALQQLPPMPSLRELDVSSNALTSLEGVGASMPALESLFASHNMIAHPGDLDACRRLRDVWLLWNQLREEAVVAFRAMPFLKSLHMSGNPAEASGVAQALVHTCLRLEVLNGARLHLPAARDEAHRWAVGMEGEQLLHRLRKRYAASYGRPAPDPLPEAVALVTELRRRSKKLGRAATAPRQRPLRAAPPGAGEASGRQALQAGAARLRDRPPLLSEQVQRGSAENDDDDGDDERPVLATPLEPRGTEDPLVAPEPGVLATTTGGRLDVSMDSLLEGDTPLSAARRASDAAEQGAAVRASATGASAPWEAPGARD